MNTPPPAKPQPNVILIMTDQQRADLCRREGYALDTTPFLDQLAAKGVWFKRAYTAAPICVAARVSMLTGRFPSATHVRANPNEEDAFFSKDLFHVFRENGYAVGLCGKNHSHLRGPDADFWFSSGYTPCYFQKELGHFETLTPEDKKYNEWLGSNMEGCGVLGPTPFPLERQHSYRDVSASQRWIESLAGRPFFLWLSFVEPHNPYQVPEPYYSMFPPEKVPPPAADETALPVKGFKFQWCKNRLREAYPDFDSQMPRFRSNYLGMLRMLDDQIKRLAEFLKRQNLLENTILVFLADHGDFAGEYGLMRKGPEVPECLVRIPMLFAGAGIQKYAGAHPAHVSIVDVLPTLCEAIGVALPAGVQGRSLWPLLSGAAYPKDEFSSAYVEQGFGGLHYTGSEPLEPLLNGLHDGFRAATNEKAGRYDELNSRTQSGTMRMVRKGDWKLVFDMQGRGQLYNLKEDPAELHNCFRKAGFENMERELLAELLTWILRTQDNLPYPRQSYIVKTDPRNYWTPYR